LNLIKKLVKKVWNSYESEDKPELIFNRLIISSNDCDDAIKFLEAYEELTIKDEVSGNSEFYTHRRGLLIAAIISYSRAFTDARSKGFAAPKVRVDIGSALGHNVSNIKLHKAILDKRHKAVAHADWKYHTAKLIENNKDSFLVKKSVVSYQDINSAQFKGLAVDMRNYFRNQASSAL
jgi:hypothetical protein